MVVNLIINSPRPFTRPGRFDSVTSPLTYDPAGITTFPSIITGNKVSKYTGSPGRALRVDTALCSTSGICVPAGTMIFAAGATAAAPGAPEPAGTPGVEAAPFAAGAAEPAADGPADPTGAGPPAAPEEGAPADGSGVFCVVAWFEEAAAGGGGIGPASCAATGSAHPAARNNR